MRAITRPMLIQRGKDMIVCSRNDKYHCPSDQSRKSKRDEDVMVIPSVNNFMMIS